MTNSRATTHFSQALFVGIVALTTVLGASQTGRAEDRPWELLVCGSYSGYFTLSSVAEEFEKIHGFEPKVAGNPNPVGFRHLASKGYDVMAFSDTLPHKLDQFRTEYFPKDGPQPRRFLLGQYAVVVLVHPSNPVRAMTYEQLEKVFIGEAPRWKAVEGGTGREVMLVGPKESQKAPAIFRRQVLNYKEFPRSMQRLDSGPQIAAYVAKNPGAIGFALLEQEPFENVRMISITKGEGEPIVPPRKDKIFSHEYPLREGKRVRSLCFGPLCGRRVALSDFAPALARSGVPLEARGNIRDQCKTRATHHDGTVLAPPKARRHSLQASSQVGVFRHATRGGCW